MKSKILLLSAIGFSLALSSFADPLPDWNAGPNKSAIVEFVENVTDPASPSFVPEQDRIAVFDNDGTLWCEQPIYTQLRFALDRVKEMAPEHPEWKKTEPFKSLLTTSRNKQVAVTEAQLMDIVMATHAGMTTEEFDWTVSDWITNAKHPKYDRLYTDLVYTPMLGLMSYLEVNGFHVFIVSGGGIAFMRPWTERVYGIPPEQVVGSAIEVKYEVRDGTPVLVREPKIDFIDDKAGKPVGIHKFIGKRPTIAVGNSDGDFEMLEWTTAGKGARLGVIIHHDDAEREYAYDRESHIGKLDRALDEGPKRGWKIISMKKDFKTVFPEK